MPGVMLAVKVRESWFGFGTCVLVGGVVVVCISQSIHNSFKT